MVLLDDSGNATAATVAVDAEAEVLAWRPRGPLGTRYRVRAIANNAEGWLEAASLRRQSDAKTPARTSGVSERA